jgi:hypothetical protein
VLAPWFPRVIAGEWASYWVFANWTLALTVAIAVVLAVLYLVYTVCSVFVMLWQFLMLRWPTV